MEKRRGHRSPRAREIEEILCSSTVLHIVLIHSTKIGVPSVCQAWGKGTTLALHLFL